MERTAETSEVEITRIHLRNIRGFRELDLDLSSQGVPRKRTLIIGKNGTCKSTILRAIAIGLADITDASKLISEPIGGLVSEGQAQGEIKIDAIMAAEQFTFTKIIERAGDKESVIIPGLRSGWLFLPFVCAYGAGRFGAGEETARGYRLADSVATLFRYQQGLIGPELTLHRLQSVFGSDVYERTIRGLKRALGLSDEDTIELRPGGGVIVEGPAAGGRVPLEGWADGYRLTFNWILDLYAWALRARSLDEEGHIEGILLIDEIEQHLHPSMQAEILPRLSELFPKLQIFATTHSPLVALDASPDELVVLRREGDQIVAEENVPNFLGYSVEDMLADPRLFDSEVYGTDVREKLTTYRELAAIPKEERDPEQRRRLRGLATEIRSFEGPRDQENETSRLLKQLMAKHNL